MKKKQGERASSIFGEFHLRYSPPAWARRLFFKANTKADGDAAPPPSEAAPDAEAPRTVEPELREALPAAELAQSPAVEAAAKPGPFAWLRSLFNADNRPKILFFLGLLVILAGALAFFLAPPPQRIDFSVDAPSIRAQDALEPPPLSLNFTGPAARLELADRQLESGARLDPPLPGLWSWVGDSQLVFRPSQDWPIGASYAVELDKEIFSEPGKLAKRRDSFQTPAFSASIVSQELYINPTDPGEIRARVELAFTFPVDREAFKAAVSMNQAYSLSFDGKGLAAYIVSSPLVPQDFKASTVELKIRGGYGPAAPGNPFTGRLEASIRVPGIYEGAQINGVETSLIREESYEYRRVLSFSTSRGIEPGELARSLKLYLLPADRKESPGTPADPNHQWGYQEVDAALLAASEKLPFESVPIEGLFSNTISFLIDAPSNRSIYLKLPSELKFAGGFRSADAYEGVLRLEPIPKEVRIMYEGSVLSMAGERRISLYANDVENVVFEIGRIIPDQVNHFVTQTGGSFGSPRFDNYDFGLENISVLYREVRALRKLDPGKVQYFSFDFDTYLKREADPRLRYGLFALKVSEYDAEKKGPTQVGSQRFVLVTDLGILAKRNDQVGYDFFVQSIHSGEPVEGAKVEVIGKNGLPVLAALTDASGHAFLPRLDGFQREKSPAVFVVTKGSDMSFLPVDGRGRFLNYSRFDVGGVYGSADPGFVDAYLFSDRGLYRPGEEAHVGIVVKSGAWDPRLAGLPLEIAVEDPRGLEILRRGLRLSASGFEEFTWKSLESAPTGKYEVKLYLARDKEDKRLLGSTAVKVEEFKPDRLSIKARIAEDTGLAWVPLGSLKAELSLMNLYGAPAAGNEVRGRLVLRPGAPTLREYRDYRFSDPFATDKSFEEELPATRTDAEGKAVLPIDLQRFGKASYLLRVDLEGREKEGGRSVRTDASILVSPLEAMVGYRADGSLSYINRGAERSVAFIAVNPLRKQVALKGLKLRIEEARFVSVLEKGPDGLLRYRSVEKILPLSARDFSIPEKGGSFELPTKEAGEYILSLEDPSGLKLLSLRYTVAGSGQLARSLDKNAELQIRLDQSDYSPGEEISINIVAPYTGSGLITVERDKVYSWKWFHSETNASVQTIKVPAGLEGSAYVNVSFLRSIDSREIYASPLSYGVAPFSVSRARRANPVQLSLPGEIKSGSSLKVGYKSANPSRIVVFGVDEGILQVARYKSPAPLDHFFRKRALEVDSLQILDLVLPEYSIIRELSAMGGDDDGLARNLNPFKRKNKPPVAFWSGILPCDSRERSFEYRVPDWFNGSIRVFAVAISDERIGTAEDSVTARSDFVITPNVPPVLGPGDSFEVGVSLMDDLRAEGETEVELRLEASEHFQILGESSFRAPMRRGEESTRFFRLQVRDKLGEGRLRFLATGGGASSSIEESVSLRPAMPFRVQLVSGTMSGGEKQIPLTRSLHPEFGSVKAIGSFLPTGLSLGLKDYLDTYPYGCTEQILSRAFPAIALKNAAELAIGEKEALAAFAQAQSVIAARQTANGSVGLWSARDQGSGFVTAYALHFLTEARELGFPVDPALLSAGLQALRNVAAGASQGFPDPASSAYAIYVLTRNGVVTTNLINALLDSRDLPREWKSGPVAAYLAGAYALLNQEAEAARLLDSALAGGGRRDDPFYSNLASASLCLYMSARHLPKKSGIVASKALEKLTGFIEQAEFNTLSSSYAILALGAYARLAASEAGEALRISAKDGAGAWAELEKQGQAILRAAAPLGSAAIRFAQKGNKPLYYQVLESGFDREPPAESERKGIEILREYTDSAGAPIQSVELGQEIEVHLKIRSSDPERKTVENVAIVDLFPSGFELAEPAGAEGLAGSGSLAPAFVEAREDRLIVYCEAREGAKEFVYRIKPTVSGSFALAPLFAESMYDRGIWCLTPVTGGIEVKAPAR